MGKRKSFSVPRVWQYIGLGVLGVVVLGMVVQTFQPTVTAAGNYVRPSDYADSYGPTPVEKPTAVFIGDSYSGGSSEDSGENLRWPALVSRELGLVKKVLAMGGSGYVAVGPSGSPITALAEKVPDDADLVVIYGSRNDVASEAEIYAVASGMYADIKSRAPGAQIVVVGPTWVSSSIPGNIQRSEAALARAASDNGIAYHSSATWIADRPDLIGADGVHPNDQGHAVIAENMQAILSAAMGG